MEESWTCGRCTYHNGLGRDACVLCGCGRDGGECESRAASDEASAQNASQEVTLFAVLPCRRILHGAIRGVFALVGSFAGALAGAVAGEFLKERAIALCPNSLSLSVSLENVSSLGC